MGLDRRGKRGGGVSASEELQSLIYATLTADADVSAIVGGRVKDGRPTEYPCITFGPSDYVPDDAECITGREETVQLDCWVRDSSARMWPVKALTDAVKDALHDAELTLTDNALCFIRVDSVRAMMDPDGLTAHGVVMVTATIEEAETA